VASRFFNWYADENGVIVHIDREDAEKRGLSRSDAPQRPSWSGRSREAPAVRGVFMHKEERQEILDKTGRNVDDRNGLDQVYRETGLREAEPGEKCYAQIDALREVAEGASPDPILSLENYDLYGDRAKRKPFNAQERLAYHRQRLGLNMKD
jgi:hypothetical protein